MDITPKPSSAPIPKASHASATETSIVSNIEDLNLEPDKLYKARVQQQIAQKDLQHSTAPNQNSKDTRPTQTAQEWILNIEGKLVKASGKLPIQVGQTLLVRLGASDTNSPASLLIVKPGEQHAIDAKAGSLAQDNSLLLNALSRLLPKQLSLASGFAALNEINSKLSLLVNNEVRTEPQPNTKQTQTSASNKATEQTQFSQKNDLLVVKSVIDSLIKSLPNSEQLTARSPQNTVGSPANLVEQVIHKSGLFFEASLQNKRVLAALENQLQIIGQIANSLPQQSTGKSINSGNTPTPGLSQTQGKKFTPEQTLQNLLRVMDSAFESKEQKGDEPKLRDLKASLIGLSQLLRTPLTANTSSSQTIEQILGSLIEPELLSAPFNFPRIHSQAHSRAQAILADQELSTGQLLKILASMLNRIQFNQLNSIYQSQSLDSNTTQSWFFELPIVNTNQHVTSFDMRIDKEKNPSHQNKEDNQEQALQWKLTLSFDIEELGPMYIQVSLLPPSISSVIWAHREDTVKLAQSEVEHFKNKLCELGLEPGDIICQHGLPSQQTTKLTQSLVDVQA